MAAKTREQGVAEMDAFMTRVQIANAPAWMPKEGDTLRNAEVVGFRKGIDKGYGEYGIVVYKVQDDNGDDKYVAFHVFHLIAKERMQELGVKVGDKHNLMYLGVQESSKTKKNAKGEDEPQTYHLTYIEKADGTADVKPDTLLEEFPF